MISNVNSVRFAGWIALLAICSNACKSRKLPASENRFEGLVVKFERMYIEGCTQNNIGNYTAALTQFNKCSDIKPDEASVYYQISLIRQKLNEDNACFQNASKANTLAPGNKFYALHYAALLRNVGDYNKAVQVLELSIKSNLKDENLYKSLDAIYEIQKLTDKRIAIWLQYKENAGFKVSTGQKLVNLYMLKKDYASVHATYEELKKAAPNKSQFYIEDAKLYEQEKDDVNAIKNYEKAVENNPNNWEVNYALYQYYMRKSESGKAKYYCKLAFEKSTTGFETCLPACQQLLESAEKDTQQCPYAFIAANGLVINYPTEANALFTSAELFKTCGYFKEGLHYFESACGYNPNLFDAWTGGMDCGLKLRNYSRAIQLGERAMEYFPNSALLFNYVAKASNLDKQYGKAFENAVLGEKFAFDDEMKSGLFLQKGLSLYHQKKYNEALQVVKEAIAINETDPELYDLMGNIFFYLDDKNKAVEYWQLARNKGSRNMLIEKKITEKKVYEQ